MTPRRAASWTIVGALAAAWFASAAGVIGQPWRTPRVPAQTTLAPEADVVSFDVEAQADRLRKRLAVTPAPQPVRNPFAFAPKRPVETRPALRIAGPPPVVAPVDSEPPLRLIGVAENGAGEALVRTAMIVGADDELVLVRVGDQVGGRYTVTAIGADAVELKDQARDRIRRLSMR